MASVMDKEAATTEATYVVEFDTQNGNNYMCCQACCILPLATSCMVLPCLPCLPYCQQKEFESQRCKVTDKRIEYEGGWLNHVTKNVPLDRVQDVSISQGCIQRCFDIKSVNVQTAGGSADGAAAEVSLLAPKNAEMIRDLILQRRDHFVLGPGASNGNRMAAGAGIDDICKPNKTAANARTGSGGPSNEQLAVEVRELKEVVMRIEEHVAAGLKKMDEPRLD
jgi:membrane protein YdbS with pleckstrin-like domain